MIDAFYTAAAGVSSLQKGMDVIANNTANVSTDGFKKATATFADLVYTNIHASEEDTRLKAGHGVKLDQTNVIHSQGNIRATDRALDFAIVEDGFFAFETPAGTKYSRAGSFHISEEDGEMYVVNMNNNYLLDQDGERVTIAEQSHTDKEGNVTTTKDINAPIDAAVYVFSNNDGLNIEGGLYFTETANSGAPEANPDARVMRRMLEASNTDLAQTMADMIQYQRAFQFNSKLVQAADEIMQTVNSLRN